MYSYRMLHKLLVLLTIYIETCINYSLFTTACSHANEYIKTNRQLCTGELSKQKVYE